MFGSKITSIRLARGYTQDYIAKQIGIDQRSYSKIEKDQKLKFDDNLLSQIAEVLGVSIEDIRSPTPIIMTFQNNSEIPEHKIKHEINESLVDALRGQLQEKDKQISQKDQQIDKLLDILTGG